MGSLHICAYLCIFCAYLNIIKFAYNIIFTLMHIPAYSTYYTYLCMIWKFIFICIFGFVYLCLFCAYLCTWCFCIYVPFSYSLGTTRLGPVNLKPESSDLGTENSWQGDSEIGLKGASARDYSFHCCINLYAHTTQQCCGWGLENPLCSHCFSSIFDNSRINSGQALLQF